MQNTQNSFRIYGDGIEMPNMIGNLLSLAVSMFCPISPDVNWKNTYNWLRTKCIFQPSFKQVHLLAISSDIGTDPLYFSKHLVGGAAILTFGLSLGVHAKRKVPCFVSNFYLKKLIS